ncbi:AraC family transcriptional regulator [Vibrio kyushuensis]|uniref:helix-turn-helix domain-containing protein n=1 Tax=Vibrio kyushuensis TaxID=2910249 RepID=UPI003D09D543
MSNTISIRSYSRQKRGHSHPFHQLVLPLRGVINLEIESYTGKVTPGECVIIQTGQMHYFTAQDHAKFVIVDMDELPGNLTNSDVVVFTITPPLKSFLSFVEQQLIFQVSNTLEGQVFALFNGLLKEQRLVKQLDHRVRNVLDHMEENLSDDFSIESLAHIACLSPTQLKLIFKKQTKLSVMQYLTQMRMEKAQALLLNTDYPISIVAENVGYRDPTAFSRRFTQYFGLTPSKFSQ